MPTVRIVLNIRAEEFLAWYRGTARSVFAKTEQGQTVQFPASALQRYVHPNGIQGEFLLTYDDRNRFVSLDRVKPASGIDELG